MKKYFYIENNEQQGPFFIDELKGRNINSSTPIWFEGMADWTTAGEVEELKNLLEIEQLPEYVPEEKIENLELDAYIPPSEKQGVQQPLKDNQPPKQQNFRGNYPPKTWFVESILVTLFCCLPFGIAGIVHASKVESAFYAGDVARAERASREAAKWTKIGFWIALGFVGMYFVSVILQILFVAGDLVF